MTTFSQYTKAQFDEKIRGIWELSTTLQNKFEKYFEFFKPDGDICDKFPTEMTSPESQVGIITKVKGAHDVVKYIKANCTMPGVSITEAFLAIGAKVATIVANLFGMFAFKLVKIVYRAVKLIYFIYKAVNSSDADTQWEYWGKAAGSAINIVWMVLNPTARRRRRMRNKLRRHKL